MIQFLLCRRGFTPPSWVSLPQVPQALSITLSTDVGSFVCRDGLLRPSATLSTHQPFGGISFSSVPTGMHHFAGCGKSAWHQGAELQLRHKSVSFKGALAPEVSITHPARTR
jgi:hypothetical protein